MITILHIVYSVDDNLLKENIIMEIMSSAPPRYQRDDDGVHCLTI